MRYEGDVDSIYEQRLSISDLDFSPFDDGDEWLTGIDIDDEFHETENCVNCGKRFYLDELEEHPDNLSVLICHKCLRG